MRIIITKRTLMALLWIFICLGANSQLTSSFKSKEIPLDVTLQTFCDTESEVVQQFFDQINLDYAGLSETKRAVESKNWVLACQNLLKYYQMRQTNSWLTKNKTEQAINSVEMANSALVDSFTFQDVKGKLPILANGRRNWHYKGPKGDMEWAYFLNRFFYLNDLSYAYRQKRDGAYAKLYNDLLTDWITSNPVLNKYTSNAAWRPLEVAIRTSRGWIVPFFEFQQAPEFKDITRLLVLMSLYDHAEYLRKFHGSHHNHAVMEFISLTKKSLNFPEFKKADLWYNEAVVGMEEEIRYSSYPDGAVKELTSHYHTVVARDFGEYIDINRDFGKTLPEYNVKVYESITNYLAYTARPDGIGLHNNDSDQKNNFDFIKSSHLKKPDWDYITTNGKTGSAPKVGSIMFPWAGQLIMRNGYGEKPGKDQFAFFDLGPWGTTHQHNDKLHFSLYAYGRELLCDNGRMYYKRDSIKSYFNLSIGHNVVVLDDKGQNQTATTNIKPVDSSLFSIQPEIDFALGIYNEGFDDKSINAKSYSVNKSADSINGKHTRAVVYLKDRYWIIVDQIKKDKPRKITAYWHFNPDCNIGKTAQTVFSNDVGKSNLMIIPVGNQAWDVSLIKGQLLPYVQGWFSKVYNNRQPTYCAEYQIQSKNNTEIFAWIMYPSENEKFPAITTRVINVSDNNIHFEINASGQEPVEFAINMDTIAPIKLLNNKTLNGRCAVIQKGKQPLVIHGKILDK